MCTKVPVTKNIPSTRWGHGAAVLDSTKLIILGGRNENDVNDIHCYNTQTQEWSELEVAQPLPKPRRRHSTIIVSGCLVMFGGFDGEFFNALPNVRLIGD